MMDAIRIDGKDGYRLTIHEAWESHAIWFEIRHRDEHYDRQSCTYYVHLPEGISAEEWLLELANDGRPEDVEGHKVVILVGCIDFDFGFHWSPMIINDYYGIESDHIRKAIKDALAPKSELHQPPRSEVHQRIERIEKELAELKKEVSDE